jgi:hypothetical protein
VWSHIIQPKSGQTKFNGLTNVWPSTGEIWLKTSRLRHAVYHWCIVTLINRSIVLSNVSLENVTFESRSVSSCSSSLMSRSILWPEYAMIFGTGTPTNVYDRTYILYCMFTILILNSQSGSWQQLQ